jgi:hypothetical protein
MHRTLIASTAVIPVAATTIRHGTAPDDPIFAAVARYCRAIDVLETIDQLAEPVRYRAAEREMLVADEAVFNTPPTTLAGCQALIEHMLDDAASEVGSHSHRTLVTLSEALDRLTGQTRPSSPSPTAR